MLKRQPPDGTYPTFSAKHIIAQKYEQSVNKMLRN